jgi:hypothetical protein
MDPRLVVDALRFGAYGNASCLIEKQHLCQNDFEFLI